MSLFRAGSGIWRVAASGVAAHAAGGAWWEVAGQTCVAAYQPKGAADIAASYVNLANPGTKDCTAPVAAPTFEAATGWTFDGSNDYLIAPVGLSDNRVSSLVVRFSDAGGAQGSKVIAGATDINGPVYPVLLIQLSTATNTMIYGNGGSAAISPFRSYGVMAVAGNRGYFDGESDTGDISNVAETLSSNLAIGGRFRSPTGTADFFCVVKIQAVAIYSTTLTAGEVAALTVRMAAL